MLLILAGNVLNFRDVGTLPSGDAAPPPAAEDQAALGGRVQSPGTDFGGIEAPLEARLKDILEKIVGVGEVDVLVTVDSTEENVWGKDDNTSQQVTDETDKSGGKRHVTQMTSSGKIVMYEVSGEQKPVVTKIVKPKVRGCWSSRTGRRTPPSGGSSLRRSSAAWTCRSRRSRSCLARRAEAGRRQAQASGKSGKPIQGGI